MKSKLAITFLSFAFFWNAANPQLIHAADPQWFASGDLNFARRSHAAVLLSDGRVLVAGGSDGDDALASTEIFDPTTETWSLAGNMTRPRASLQLIGLDDGRVLAFGGRVGGVDLKTAEIYNPETDLWTSTGSLANGRFAPLVVRMNDGRVLTAGGYDTGVNDFIGTAEIYDPDLGLWSRTGSYNTSANKQTGVLLGDGTVLSVGGYNGGGTRHQNAEIYDPSTERWTNTGFMSERRYRFAAEMLDDGRVLAIAGGNNGSSNNITSEIYDPDTGRWTPTGNLQYARRDNLAAKLPGGQVLTVGGGLSPTEVYDPNSGLWSSGGFLTSARSSFTLTPLDDGRVLAVGGSASGEVLRSAEAFSLDPSEDPTRATFVSLGAQWRYFDNGSNPGAAWTSNEFSDTQWPVGDAPLGYGDNDEATVVRCGPSAPACTSSNQATTYFRSAFEVEDVSLVESIAALLVRDDAAAVYLNGIEVYRDDNLASNADYRTFATSTGAENGVVSFVIETSLLAEGENTIAVEIHQASSTSSDISFDLSLTARINPVPEPGTLSMLAIGLIPLMLRRKRRAGSYRP